MRLRFIGWLLVAFACVATLRADLEFERPRASEQEVRPWSSRSYVDTFKAGKRAVAIVSGSGATCLGLYVFDENGNCLAVDELSTPKTSDDLAVEWIPGLTSRYQVEVRNGGFLTNIFDLALR